MATFEPLPLPDLEPGEIAKDVASNELLWRVVPPDHFDEDRAEVMTTAFQDGNRQLSVSQENLVSPRVALDYFVENGPKGKREAQGVWAITPAECASVDCRVVDDHGARDDQAPGHAYVDTRHTNHPSKKNKTYKAERLRIANRLAFLANRRGEIAT